MTFFSSIGNSKWPASKEEQIATWSFVVLDKNKNKILERKEWKSFRLLVSTNILLRRCGKRLPRYCDINHDKKISITEWLNCLDAHLPTTPSTDQGKHIHFFKHLLQSEVGHRQAIRAFTLRAAVGNNSLIYHQSLNGETPFVSSISIKISSDELVFVAPHDVSNILGFLEIRNRTD